MITGFYMDKEGIVHKYEAEEGFHLPEVPEPGFFAESFSLKGEVVMTEEVKRKHWKARRRAQRRNNIIRASVLLATAGAFVFALLLSGETPHYAAGFIGSGANLMYVGTVLYANGGQI